MTINKKKSQVMIIRERKRKVVVKEDEDINGYPRCR